LFFGGPGEFELRASDLLDIYSTSPRVTKFLYMKYLLMICSFGLA
jgi:hypothetical protein